MSFLVRLDEAGAARGEIGGKARSLLRLAAAGLPVPPAVVVTAELFRALRDGGGGAEAGLRSEAEVARAPWPPGFEAALAAAVARLGAGAGARFAVRSSAAVEDRAGALAPGIFLSRVDVAATGVAAAVREVLASALAPAAAAYAARFGLAARDLEMAVLVHPFEPGDAAGTAAFDPDAMTAPLVEAAAGAAALAPGARAAIERAARTLAAAGGAVEIEWVSTGGAVRFLQARPYRAAARAVATVAAATTAQDPWRWDAAHNPLPLSPAQAGLVAFVDERCRTAFRQQVRDGYLFYRRTREAGDGAEPEGDAAGSEPWAPGRLAATLRALAAAVDARLARPGRAPAGLEEALEIFAGAYEPLYGVVQPRAAAARAALAARVRAEGGGAAELGRLLAGVSSAASERATLAGAIASAPDATARAAAVAAYLARFGDEAPVWDVAVPTYREDPSALERLASVARPSAAAPARPAAQPPDPLVEAAREAAAVAEDDDALYARAQAAVRRALLAEGARLVARGALAQASDVFWLPLATTRALASGGATDSGDAAAGAAGAVTAARAAYARQLATPPPPAASAPATADAGDGTTILRGLPASPGRVVGRVRLHPAPPGPLSLTLSPPGGERGSEPGPLSLTLSPPGGKRGSEPGPLSLTLSPPGGERGSEPGPLSLTLSPPGGERGSERSAIILVARTLLPTELPLIEAAGLVIETGGVLDHVATQARERGIPAVVSAPGACTTLHDGDHVLVDGDAGTVHSSR